ncbi:MAG: tRNA (guanosine(46)-N7)-methyltransferase TrmB [Leptolyngbyaceae cyanobacterium SL_7_1]|nr:tRNA (guanosine(46)-N7)-methyltransferase TrmB [Leptolyngbyaceae cyanobacterium SL_7_1]
MAVRVRQHVNPLSQKYQRPIAPPHWETIYVAPHQPLHLDIGCGRGQFALQMAQTQSDWNFLGLEIREPLVEQALEWRDAVGLTNLHYLFCNVSRALEPLLASLPIGVLQRVTIQFPDPWFKKRHQKRRVVQPETVAVLANHLIPGGTVLLQSDVEQVAIEMVDRFAAHSAFGQWGAEPWLAANPLPIPTEREISTLQKGEPVYRALLIRQ